MGLLHPYGLNVHELLDAIVRKPPSIAGLLDPAERKTGITLNLSIDEY